MLTGVAYLEMRVRDFAACRKTYRDDLGLEEIAHGVGGDGYGISMIATGSSFLELREDPNAITVLLPSGERKEPVDVPGSVGHISFYVDNNDHAFAVLKEFLVNNPRATADGPDLQPVDHAYMQRTLLQFDDPSGYVVQISDVVDPRPHLEKRRAEKRDAAAASGRPGLLQGFDHLNTGYSDIRFNRDLFGQKLGMEEISHRTGEGWEEGVFAVGITDLEISQNASLKGKPRGAGAVSGIGFWTEDVESAYLTAQQRGVDVAAPPSERTDLPGIRRRGFSFEGLDGLPLEIAQLL